MYHDFEKPVNVNFMTGGGRSVSGRAFACVIILSKCFVFLSTPGHLVNKLINDK